MQEARFDLRKFSIESSQLRNAKDSAVPASGLSKTPTHMLDDVDRKPLGATHVAWAWSKRSERASERAFWLWIRSTLLMLHRRLV